MIPRGAPYISWSDLAAAALNCLAPGDGHATQARVEQRWAPNSVALLSVRSGLDALFRVLALPPESEVILSAITIPHILDILAHHRLVAVPVDVDVATLAVNAAEVRAAITGRTVAILVAHLFGSRMPLDDVVSVAREHALLLIEDCAQANDGTDYRGHCESDVCLFSFGSIKRQTALGGALLRFKDAALAERVRQVQAGYPVLARGAYFKRVVTMVFVKTVASRPVFDLFLAACRTMGRNHDEVLGTALRGFKHGDLFGRLRQQPGAPLMRTLERRLAQESRGAIDKRMSIVQAVSTTYPALSRAGANAAHHTHWLFPMATAQPERLMHHLWTQGYDATRGASNLVCVPAPRGRASAQQAARLMADVLYLPLCPSATASEMQQLAGALRAYDAVSSPS